MNKFVWLWKFLLKHGLTTKHTVQLFILFSLMSLVGILQPLVIHEIYQNKERVYLLEVLGFYLFLIVVQFFIRVAYQMVTSRLCLTLVYNLRAFLFDAWIYDRSSWKFAQAKQWSLGEIQARLLSDTDAVKEIVDNGSLTIIIDLLFVLSSLLSFLWVDKFLGLVLLISQIIIVALLSKGSVWMSAVFLHVRKSYADLTKNVSDVISGLSQIYGLPQSYAVKRVTQAQDKFLAYQMKSNLYDASYYSFAESLLPIFMVIFVLFAPMSVGSNVAIVGVVLDLLQRSVGPIKELASKIAVLQRAYAGLSRVSEFHEKLYPVKWETKDLEGDWASDWKEVSRLKITIPYFAHYTATSQSRTPFTLKEIEFELIKGEPLGLTGHSGSGKSTLLHLLALQLNPNGATVTALGKKSCHFVLAQRSDQVRWISTLAFISQDAHLFSQTLCYNLTLQMQVPEHFHNFWQHMLHQIPYLSVWGIDPYKVLNVGQLSFGQKQLISAMRALYLKRSIILFDEMSAGMDPLLEQSLYKFMDLFTRDCFVINVAHRLEIIKRSKHVLVMKEGSVVASGTHEELIKNSAYYVEYFSHL
jgi:ATP-binding cassette subfamily B protein